MSARTARVFGAALAALLLIAAAEPESRLEQYFRLRGEAAKAVQAGDLATAEQKFETALALYPTSPGSLIRLARVEVAAGKPGEAVAHLADYADLGLVWDVAGDGALKVLVDRPDFAPVAARLAENARPVGRIAGATAINEPDLLNEGITFDGEAWLVSSVNTRMITLVNGSAQAGVVPGGWSDGDGEDGGIFGLTFDRKAGVVWAIEARGEGIPGSSGPAESALLKLERRQLDVLARYPIPADGQKHQLGDVAVGPDGTIYASDSVGAVIYRLKPGATALEPFVASREMGSPQGMVVCPGGGAMVVADYSTGLHRIDLATGKDELVGGMKAALAGTDGLFQVPYDFGMRNASPLPVAMVATQNGVTPQRVMFLRLSPDCRTLEDATVMAANLPGLDDLTLGAYGQGQVAVIGSSGWSRYDGEGKATTPQARPAELLFLPLP